MTNEQAIELLQFYKKGLFDAASNQLSGDIQAFDLAIQALSQEPKTGHWIVHEHAEEFYGRVVDNYECDNCGDWYLNKTNFCPNCGARMVEPQEISGRNLKMWHDIYAEEKRRKGSNKK